MESAQVMDESFLSLQWYNQRHRNSRARFTGIDNKTLLMYFVLMLGGAKQWGHYQLQVKPVVVAQETITSCLKGL